MILLERFEIWRAYLLSSSNHHSFTFVFTFSGVVVDLLADCILSILFPAETDVLVPVFSQSTDVVVVNFVVVLKFPIIADTDETVKFSRRSDRILR